MAREDINYGTSIGDENADGTRAGFEKSNNNFIELYDLIPTNYVTTDSAQNVDAYKDFKGGINVETSFNLDEIPLNFTPSVADILPSQNRGVIGFNTSGKLQILPPVDNVDGSIEDDFSNLTSKVTNTYQDKDITYAGLEDLPELTNTSTESITEDSTEVGYILVGTTGNVFANASYDTKKYTTQGIDVVFITGRSSASNFTLFGAYDINDNYLGDLYRGTSTNYVDQEVDLTTLFPTHNYIKVTGNSTIDVKKEVTVNVYTTPEDLKNLTNHWYGKNIYWCGTSIPARGYPEVVGENIGANIFNEAIGSSFMRANVRTGDYVNALRDNIVRGLTQTKEEKQYIEDNWSTIRSSLSGSPTTDLTASELTALATSSFEDVLMPYLDGTNPMPDLFVVDHGHNDWKSFYTKVDTTPDIDLIPTRALELSGDLAEDTYMTDNNFANLKLFFGDLSNITDVQEFASKLNRNCYIGAVNFFITLILKNNPNARFMFVSNNRDNKDLLLGAQDYNSSNWMFPIARVNQLLGYSSNIIPDTNNYWGDNRSEDLTVFDIYAEDGVHPSTNANDKSIQQYSGVLTEFIKTVR